ncbi:delta-aminolevulinic acid dehydratase : Delta-aminolevulinic acid dehydratase OS=uncultured planctomycete GN=HGMM_F13D05C09 PE=3 SV=1: ALAD [Gemmataceae bacterium]|nr:delta-aminolevulinic acid dehydratase : Delta-aminolevulinic acid dehydratase OS=uncultured planctomycete GN=HGMM_F13D05C09 PE=3 SV=1: ALAD [Gemmataceae bacterium]VTT96457.1 delta-aminolevulinic acid dehydratase : Delta-aminolevulinic acid dehydratase OS=uncultured planctomycete GN=HGMM_F13D05C09 PE=3 SV=1: ALAD [Gemmataceae bacterium]
MNHTHHDTRPTSPGFPTVRPRRLRYNPLVRELVRETELSTRDLILPLFVRPGTGVRQEIGSMPGNYQLSVDTLVEEVGAARDLGITAFMFFGIPEFKDARGSSALLDTGIVQQALRATRKAFGNSVLLIPDECFCEYTDHGHCGILHDHGGRQDVDNDATLEILAEQCVSHARAGADVIAPSGMMDGMVGAIRRGLDSAGFTNVPILSYAAKYASGFYGPFRDAAESPPQFGDRNTYQMDPANSDEAMKEVALDIAEGADMIMVKPALSYLDIIRRVKERFAVPVAAYNVSGEFAMVKAAAAKGWIDERRVTLEILTSIRRAGSDMILTYHARDVARWLKSG